MGITRPLLAKISTPRLFGVVPRERLFAHLDQNRGRPLVWIEGPPGAGKTTLAVSYLEARRIATLWYQVDAGDADPANLFHYMGMAAAALLDVDALALPRLAPEHLSDLGGFARTFFRSLFAALPPGVVIVLDNYQEVPDGAALHEVVQAGVLEAPPGSSVFGISRVEAPPSFSRLAGAGALFSLRWETLRLTLEETRAISAARATREDWLVRALHQQSEGWAAGITLMLERLGHMEADARDLRTDTRESVFDYFASLLFDRATAHTQHVLISLAYLPHVSVSMAERLSGSAEAGAVLDHLYKRHLFTDRHPGREPVYQFHALFRDFLQRRAAEVMSSEQVCRLQVESARVLADTGEMEPAMALFLTARDWKQAEDLVLREANGLIASARWQTLERWIRALPEEVMQARPRLWYWLGVAQVQADPAAGLAMLAHARDVSARCGDRQGKIKCLAALLNTAQMGHAAIPMAEGWLGDLLDEVEAGGMTDESDALAVWSALVAVLTYWRPGHPAAADARRRVQRLIEREPDATTALAAAATVLVADTGTGNLELAEELVYTIEPLAQNSAANPGARAWFLYGAAYLRFIQARYEDALGYLDRAISAASSSALQSALSDMQLYRVMIEFRSPGWSVANVTLQQIEAQPLPRRLMSLALLRIYQARRAHFYGRWEEAADLALQCQEAISRVGAPQNLMTFGLFNAEVLIGAGRISEARPLLQRSVDIVARSPLLDCWSAATVFCQAYLAHGEGRRRDAVELLGRALTLAEHGTRRYYLRYFECCMPPLFCLARAEGIKVELVQGLIRMFRLKPPPAAPDLWPRPIRIRTLGRFEVCVGDAPLEFSRKVPKKTLALLKGLIAYRSETVPEQWLCDSLWPDEEADAARAVLGVTVLRLRKLLGNDDAVNQQGGRVRLDRSRCWVDAWRFESLLEDGREPPSVREALNLYAGAFLPEDDGQPWTVSMRERLRGKFIHALSTHGGWLEEAGEMEEATQLYLRGIDADIVVEAFHRGLMRCYQRTGRLTEAVSAYRRLRQTLSAVLGIAPSGESERIYRDLMHELANRPLEQKLR